MADFKFVCVNRLEELLHCEEELKSDELHRQAHTSSLQGQSDEQDKSEDEEVDSVDELEKKKLAKYSMRKFKGLTKEQSPLAILKSTQSQRAKIAKRKDKKRFSVVFVY